MPTFRSLVGAVLLILAYPVTSLPVSEDNRTPQFSVGNPEDTSSAANSWPDPRPDVPVKILHALGLPSPVYDAKAQQKRDDIRKYDKPQTWSFDEYHAIYLAGLARFVREDATKKRARSIPLEFQPRSSTARASAIEKREKNDDSDFPESKDSNGSGRAVDDWGISMEDYQRFYNHNLDANYQHWTFQEWQNFVNRYLEFVASGGQVGKGDRKRDRIWKFDDILFGAQSRYMRQDWHILQEWLKRNGPTKSERIGRYDSNLTDENGNGRRGEEGAEKNGWEVLRRLDVWAAINGYWRKQGISRLNQVIPENQGAASDALNDKLRDPGPLPSTSSSHLSLTEGRIFNERENSRQDGKAMSEEESLINEDLGNPYSTSIIQRQMLNKALLRKQLWSPDVAQISNTQFSNSLANNGHRDRSSGSKPQRETSQGSSSPSYQQKRDDIRKYGPHFTNNEWTQIGVPVTRGRAETILEEDNSKVKRNAASRYPDNIDFEHLSKSEIDDLKRIAMADPAFLEFQRQYLASHSRGHEKQTRSPSAPDLHQTAPAHSGPANADENQVAAANRSATSNSLLKDASSSDRGPAETKIQESRKRDDIRKYSGFTEGNDRDYEIIDGHIVESSRLTPLGPEGMYPRTNPDPTSLPDFPDGTSISDVIAAEEAADLAKDTSVQAKRDNMYNYAGGLDDWDDYVLSSLFCDEADCPENYPGPKVSLKQERDSMDKHDENHKTEENYGELLKAVKEGRARIHPRDLTNFPSWLPANDPVPPNVEPEASSKRAKRDGDLSNFPSWRPKENPVPPEVLQGAASSKKQKRDATLVSRNRDNEMPPSQDSTLFQWSVDSPYGHDRGHPQTRVPSLKETLNQAGYIKYGKVERDKVDQYTNSMTDEDEWIDIYRLYYMRLQRQRSQSTNIGGKRKQRRAPEPDPEPDTIVVRPLQSGSRQFPHPTTISTSHTPAPTELISMNQAPPGPGTPCTQTPSDAQSPTSSLQPNPSDIFYPFGTWLPLGPNQPDQPADRRRGDGDIDAAKSFAGKVERDTIRNTPMTQEDWDAFDAWLIRGQRNDPGYGLVKERRASNPSASSQSARFPAASPGIQNSSVAASPTQLENPEGKAPKPDVTGNVNNIIQVYGPLLDLVSSLPSPSAAPSLPPTGSTASSVPAKERRDSTEKYRPSTSVNDWDDAQWDILDNFVTFQEANGPKRKRQTPDCFGFDADSDSDTSARCLCSGSAEALPTLTGPDPCAYTSLPTAHTNLPRDDQRKYDVNEGEERAIYEWVMTGRYLDGGGRKPKEKRELLNNLTQGQASDEEATQQQEEQQQHQEGLEQAKAEQAGGKLMLERDYQWVPEEPELTEGLPEEAAGNGKRERALLSVTLPLAKAEGEEIRQRGEAKRHCGRADLPEGYGSNETVVCR